MKDQGRLIAALLIGATAGAIVGLLLAPDSGEALREDIAGYVNDLVSAAKTKAQSTAAKAKDYSSSALDTAKSKFKETLTDLSDQTDELVNIAREKANSAVGGAKDYGKDTYDAAKSKVKVTANDWNNTIQNS